MTPVQSVAVADEWLHLTFLMRHFSSPRFQAVSSRGSPLRAQAPMICVPGVARAILTITLLE
jgi:hypothetical protein